MTGGNVILVKVGEVDHNLGTIKGFGVLDLIALGLLDIGK